MKRLLKYLLIFILAAVYQGNSGQSASSSSDLFGKFAALTGVTSNLPNQAKWSMSVLGIPFNYNHL